MAAAGVFDIYLATSGWDFCTGVGSPSAISPSKEIDERVHAFLDRPLAGEWPHLWLDAKSRRSS